MNGANDAIVLAEIQDFSNWQFRLEARVQTEYIRPQKIPIQTGIDPEFLTIKRIDPGSRLQKVCSQLE